MAELESIELSVPLHIFEQYWALCLSWWGGDRVASRNPDHSSGHEDKHKAPTRLHVHPLSLQDGGRHSQSFPDSVGKNHQVCRLRLRYPGYFVKVHYRVPTRSARGVVHRPGH